MIVNSTDIEKALRERKPGEDLVVKGREPPGWAMFDHGDSTTEAVGEGIPYGRYSILQN